MRMNTSTLLLLVAGSFVLVSTANNPRTNETGKYNFARKLFDSKWITSTTASTTDIDAIRLVECRVDDGQQTAATPLKDALTNIWSDKPDFATEAWTAQQRQELTAQISQVSTFYEKIKAKENEIGEKCIVIEDPTGERLWLTLKRLGRFAVWGKTYKELIQLSSDINGLTDPVITATGQVLANTKNSIEAVQTQLFDDCADASPNLLPANVKTYLRNTLGWLAQAKLRTTRFTDHLLAKEEAISKNMQDTVNEVSQNYLALNFLVKKLSTLCRAAGAKFSWPHEQIGSLEAYGELMEMLKPPEEGGSDAPAAFTIPDRLTGSLFRGAVSVPALPADTSRTASQSSASSGTSTGLSARNWITEDENTKKEAKRSRPLQKLSLFLSEDNYCPEETTTVIEPAAYTAPPNMTRAIESGFGSLNRQFDKLATAVDRIAESVGSLAQLQLFRMTDDDRSRFTSFMSSTTPSVPEVTEEQSEQILNAGEEVGKQTPPFVSPQGPSNLMSRPSGGSSATQHASGSVSPKSASRSKRSADTTPPNKLASTLSDIMTFLTGGNKEKMNYEKEFQNWALENMEMPEARPAAMTSSAMDVSAPAAMTMPDSGTKTWGKKSTLDKESAVTQTLKQVLGWVGE